MKFTKAFLFASLMASAMILTACNEKESKADKAPQTAQSVATEDMKNQQFQVDELVNQAAQAFLKVANVSLTNINMPEDGKSFSITYSIENIADKAISSLQWITVYKSEGKAFYVANPPALQFEKTIAPKATEAVTLSTDEEAILAEIRPYMKPGANIQVEVIGTMVKFADGSVVGLTATK